MVVRISALCLLVFLFVAVHGSAQENKIINISSDFTSTVAGTPIAIADPTEDQWIVAWRKGSTIRVRTVKESGTMGATKSLATGVTSGERDFDLALDTNGGPSHLLAFDNSAGLQARALPSLNPGTVHLIEAGAKDSLPRLVFDPSGRYFLFWLGTQDGRRSALRVRILNLDGLPVSNTATLASAAAGQTFASLNVARRSNGSMTAIVLQQNTGTGSVLKFNISPAGTLQGTAKPFQPSTQNLVTSGDIDFSSQGNGFGLWIDKTSVKRRKVTPAGGFGGGILSIPNAASMDLDTIQAGISFNPLSKQFIGVWTNEDETELVTLNGTSGAVVKAPASIATSVLGFSRNANVSSNSEGKSLVVWEDSSFEAGTAGSVKFRIRGAIVEEGGGEGGGQVNVTIGDDFYNPQTITISVGTSVTWTNKGSMEHTVTQGTPSDSEDSRVFDFDDVTPGESNTFTFNTKGTFQYFCEIHGTAMSGTVIVQ